jgi:phosphohistidine swiveling domain-containing protein
MMMKLYGENDKFSTGHTSATVEAFHNAIREIIRNKLTQAGGHWESFVFGKSLDLITADDFRGVEKMMLDAGHKFDWSAAISPSERPDIYKQADGIGEDDLVDFSFEHPEAIVAGADGEDREQRGQGDNVAQYPELCVGTARYIRSPSQVLKYLQEGVPANTIAVIDDSGGTLTAPILERFKGVICAGGSTRSHLGILTREYGVPCLMNAKVSGIKQNDTLVLEVTAKPKTADDYQSNRDVIARVWRLVK